LCPSAKHIPYFELYVYVVFSVAVHSFFVVYSVFVNPHFPFDNKYVPLSAHVAAFPTSVVVFVGGGGC